MSSGEIVTRGLTHIMQQPPKFERDIINSNTDEDGHTTCHRCELGRIDDTFRTIKVSIGFTTPKKYKLETLFCNNCDYIFIEDHDVTLMREFLSK